MPPQDHSPMLRAQAHSLRDDFRRLLEVLESPKIPRMYGAMLVGRFKGVLSPLLYELQAVETHIQEGEYAGAWKELSELQRRTQQLMEEAQEFLGGVAIRKTALDQEMAERAQKLAEEYASQAGVDWSPVVIIGQQAASDWKEEVVVEENPEDSLIRLPIPRWDIWCLPLIAHDYGYWVAKRGQIVSFDQFVNEQTALVQRLLDDPPPSDVEVAPLLPEIRDIWDARTYAADLQKFREQYWPALELLAKRQKVHIWHLIADAFATYFVGPAYAYALLFLTLDPTRPDLEGEKTLETGDSRSRYLPADVRRMAVVMQTLQKMDEQAKADPYADGGPYISELRLLESVWEHALEVSGNLEKYRPVEDAMRPWSKRIYEGLEYHFGLQAGETAALWRKALDELVPILRDGACAPLQPDLLLLLNAAWWCRPRHFDRIATLSRDCQQLLTGKHPPFGLHAKPPEVQEEAKRLLHSRLYDLETDLERLAALFSSEKKAPFTTGEIDPEDRAAVAGRFYRLLSEQDYGLKKLQKFISMGNPLDSSLAQLIKRSRGGEMRALQREVLDFLGGVLMRKEGLDQHICDVADALLRNYARMTGVNWASRTIPGKNPLFSQASDIIHLRFPDWDIWNLPLMAHEFGHVTAFATPAFLDLLARELNTIAQGHPEASTWDEEQTRAYIERRGRHIHEFFADAFAVYCQGPAFAYDVVMLHFNPAKAYLDRGHHPTHAERVDVILEVLEAMNKQEKRDDYEPGPYAPVIGRLKDWWFPVVEKAGDEPDNVYQFHKMKAKVLAGKIYNLLNQYYRLGAQYQADDWERANEVAQRLLADEPDLSAESLRDLLNIAWACQVRHPDRLMDITKIIRMACEQHLRQE